MQGSIEGGSRAYAGLEDVGVSAGVLGLMCMLVSIAAAALADFAAKEAAAAAEEKAYVALRREERDIA